jgi:hypothetical protein
MLFCHILQELAEMTERGARTRAREAASVVFSEASASDDETKASHKKSKASSKTTKAKKDSPPILSKDIEFEVIVIDHLIPRVMATTEHSRQCSYPI